MRKILVRSFFVYPHIWLLFLSVELFSTKDFNQFSNLPKEFRLTIELWFYSSTQHESKEKSRFFIFFSDLQPFDWKMQPIRILSPFICVQMQKHDNLKNMQFNSNGKTATYSNGLIVWVVSILTYLTSWRHATIIKALSMPI